MKIAVIHSIFPPYSRGGAEMVAFSTAKAFAEQGHHVFVITCAPFEGWRSLAGKWESASLIATDKEQDSREITDSVISGHPSASAAIRVFRFTPLNLFTISNIGKYPALLRLIWHVLDMFNLHAYLVVKKILEKEKPDLIITRNLKGLGYTVPIAIRRYTLHATRYTPKWFHGLHDLGALHPRGFMEWGKEQVIRKPMVLIKLYRGITKRLFGSPDAIVAPSQFVLQEYERAGFFLESEKVVVPNPVVDNSVAPPLTPPRKGGEIDKRFPPLPEGRLGGVGEEGLRSRFLYLGQLEPYKGLRVLLDAWKKFIVDYPEARLEIAGSGSLEEEVRGAVLRIRGIQYHGFVAHEKLPALMRGVCATILPTLAYETFGLSIIESFAAGVPVIASRIGATPEIVEDGDNGHLVVPDDPNALRDALVKMMALSQQELAQRAKKSAEQYTLEKYYAALDQVYRSLT